jgi:CheY-like chemotaxis protein
VCARSAGRDRGSEFEIHLPRASDAAAPPVAAPAAGARPSLGGLRILIVDANEDAAEALRMLLRRIGGEVRVVHDGASALAALSEHAPAAVLLDIGMAEMDGYEVARRIRAAHARGPVLIAVTGWGQEGDRRRARDAGFDHHLVKPVDVVRLHEILGRIAAPTETARASR